jgi:radical SAM protein with 4Fe4S-binding SPASM domain
MKEKKPLVNTIISTNGILLTESLFRQLVKSGLDSIQISLYAGDQEEHRHITGTKTYNRVCNNIIMISKIKKELGTQKPFLQTFMMGCKENQDSFDHFIDYWSRYVEKPFIRPIYNLGRPIEGMTPLFNRTATKDRYPCITPWYSTAIRSNGDVLPCYMYHWYKESKDQVIGNINQDSIMDIWRSDKFTMFRQAHLSLQLNDYPLCQKCDLWDAYTNVWSKKRDGIFYYKHASIKDLFIKAPQHRGG